MTAGSNPDVSDPGSNPDVSDPGSNPDVSDPGSNPDVSDPGSNPDESDVARRLAATSTTTTCTKAQAQPETATLIVGEYKIASIKDTSDNSITIETVETNKYTVAPTFVISAADKQTTNQEVEKDNDKKKSFTIALDSANAAPALYPSNDSTAKALSSCTLATDSKSVSCTPAEGEMKDGEEYTIYYKAACDDKFTSTGVKVKYSASTFVSISKYAFVVLALFLL